GNGNGNGNGNSRWMGTESQFTTGTAAELGCRPADCEQWKQIRTHLQLLHAAWRLRLPPPVKECRLALEEFRWRCIGIDGT
ncbi:hypothetical protein, partial [Pseudomonas sp. NBRC 111121]